jgi:hypothetical protein
MNYFITIIVLIYKALFAHETSAVDGLWGFQGKTLCYKYAFVESCIIFTDILDYS